MAMKKLKERWGIHSNWRLGIIFLVFAVTGSSAAKITGPVVKSIGWVKELPYWQYAVLYIVSTLIIYQFLLVFFGWLFGGKGRNSRLTTGMWDIIGFRAGFHKKLNSLKFTAFLQLLLN